MCSSQYLVNYESFQNGWRKQVLFLACVNAGHYSLSSFLVIFFFCRLGCFHHTCAHQSSAKYLRGLFTDLCSALSSPPSASWFQLPPGSLDAQSHLFNAHVHQALSGFPFPAPRPGNFPGSKHSQQQGFLALFPISQGSLSLTA